MQQGEKSANFVIPKSTTLHLNLKPMEKKLYSAMLVIIISGILSSCSAVVGIFKTGMGFGIFISFTIIIIIVAFIIRSSNNKK